MLTIEVLAIMLTNGLREEARPSKAHSEAATMARTVAAAMNRRRPRLDVLAKDEFVVFFVSEVIRALL
jgi:hypothetical protein